MPKTYRPYQPEQALLLPPSLQDWLPEDHLAYFVSDVVDQADRSAIEAVYEDEERGQPPYHPLMMTKVLVYAYCARVFSSRKIQKQLAEDVAFRVLAAGHQPDFRTISDFRKMHLAALEGLFEQVLRMALAAGAMKLGRVALDSSKIQANASKHKAMSYGRMKEQERQLRAEVKQLLAQAEALDEEEDARYGKDRSGEELPVELRRRETRLKRIREAQRALEQRARQEAAAAGRPAEPAVPKDSAQYNFTDPESRIMKGPDRYVQAYSAQVAVGVAAHRRSSVTQQANDKEQLQPMVGTIRQQAGQKPQQLSADNGYCSEENLAYLGRRRIDGYIATEKQKHGQRPAPCKRGPLPKGATRVDRMRRKLQTKVGAAISALRKGIVEPVFGQIKQGRGFRQFLLRGLEKVKGEWALVCLTHNILKMYRICYRVEGGGMVERMRGQTNGGRSPDPSELMDGDRVRFDRPGGAFNGTVGTVPAALGQAPRNDKCGVCSFTG